MAVRQLRGGVGPRLYGSFGSTAAAARRLHGGEGRRRRQESAAAWAGGRNRKVGERIRREDKVGGTGKSDGGREDKERFLYIPPLLC